MHDDADDLRDPVLQRALENAPDQAATPDWRLGQSIRAMAHEAVAPSLPELPVQRSWWQRLLGIGAGGGVPWNAAFATVLVGVLVTLMWQREEVPGARLDGEPERAAPAAASAPPAAEIAQGAPAPAPAAPAAPAASEPAAAPSPSALDAQLAESRETTAAATRALDQEEARVKRERQADSDAAAARARVRKKEAVRPPAPVQLAPPAAPATAEAPSARANKQAEIAERRAFAGPQDAAPAAAAPRAAAVAPPPPAPEPAAPPSFAALSQWTVLHITRPDGETRTLQRAEARELGALIGSAALAGVGARPLRGKVDWRITLERNGEALAVLELVGGQVRWREEGVAPGIGAPGAGAMKGLRAALEEASAPAPSQPQPPR